MGAYQRKVLVMASKLTVWFGVFVIFFAASFQDTFENPMSTSAFVAQIFLVITGGLIILYGASKLDR